MNREDIEHMWKVASNDPNHDTNWHDPVVIRFAALVASAERERLTDAAMKAAEKAVDVAIALEREACANICFDAFPSFEGQVCVQLIRARGRSMAKEQA